jgi:hypothetical protein
MKKVRVLSGAALVPLAFAAGAATAIPAAAATAGPIKPGACSPDHATWFQLDTTYHGRQCWGGKGRVDPDMYAGTFCPGNNSGILYYKSPSGVYYTDDFYPGENWTAVGNTKLDYVSGVYINGWSPINYSCGGGV